MNTAKRNGLPPFLFIKEKLMRTKKIGALCIVLLGLVISSALFIGQFNLENYRLGSEKTSSFSYGYSGKYIDSIYAGKAKWFI